MRRVVATGVSEARGAGSAEEGTRKTNTVGDVDGGIPPKSEGQILNKCNTFLQEVAKLPAAGEENFETLRLDTETCARDAAMNAAVPRHSVPPNVSCMSGLSHPVMLMPVRFASPP